VLRSPHAHADIKKIDTSTAKKAPGVLLIFTGQDVQKAAFGDVPCLVPLANRDGSTRGKTPRAVLGGWQNLGRIGSNADGIRLGTVLGRWDDSGTTSGKSPTSRSTPRPRR